MRRQYQMGRPDVVMAPLSHSSSVVQVSSAPSSSHLRSSTGSLVSPRASSRGWTLPPLNQFMTLPSSFLASHFGTSMDTMYPIRNNESIITANRNINTNLPISGSTLDNLLNDEDEEWDASNHFVLPHLVHRNAVVDVAGGSTRRQEEIDLTISSSEDEGGEANAVGDSDDVIEIIEPLQTSDPSEPTLLHRKRRRPRAVASENAVLGPKRQRSMDMVRSIESTNVGMRNNEMLQRFKSELKCTICLDVLEGITSTICGHIFCAGCIRLAIRANGKCPLCQRRLHLKDTHPLFF